MTDEIRIYHVDDPNDAPERRLSTLPTISPFMPTSLPQYVIQPVASSLLTAMRDYWYLAYQQGIAAQKQQQGIAAQRQQQLLHQQRQAEAAAAAAAASSHHLYTQQQHQQQQQQQQHQQEQEQQHRQQQQQLEQQQRQQQLEQRQLEQRRSDQRQIKQDQEQEQEQEQHLQQQQQQQQQQRHQHIKKPLNPFMIYMQKRRPEIVKQGIIKESAAINQMLGQQWRKLSKEEQEPYYKLAEQEKILHAQKYPGWSARDNYANQKKKKKLKLKSISLNGLDQSDKKCRARFGLNNMASWCKPCRRKKKCIYNIPNGYKTDNHHHHHHHHTHHLHHHDNHLNHHHHHHHSVNNIID